MIRFYISIFLVAFLAQSCLNNEDTSFEDFHRSFYQWNINYSPSIMFITMNDPLLFDKRFIGDDYINDIKRFLIELNQINSKKINQENQLVYISINNFLKNNIYIYENLKFDEWNSLYYISRFYEHAMYIGKLIESNNLGSHQIENIELLVSEINFLNDYIIFFLENIKYKHTSDLQIDTLDRLIKKILNFSSSVFQDEAQKYPSTDYSKAITGLITSLDKLNIWKQKHYNKLNVNPHKLSEISYKKYLHLNSDYKLDFDTIINQIITDLNKYEKMLFDYSLPIYLETNDEPVWTDFSDTTHVVTSSLENLDSYSYHCSDKDVILKFINLMISDIFKDDIYTDINVRLRTNPKLDLGHNYDFFNHIDANNLNITTSSPHSLLFDNYYYTIDKIFPGDFFIYNQILNLGDDFNSIYVNKNYFYGYKFLLMDQLFNTNVYKFDDFEICGTMNSVYLKAMRLFYIRDRIVDALTAIVAIEYFLGDGMVEDSIRKYDRIGLIDDNKKNILLEEIFGYKMDSIVKFTSINKLKNIIYGMNKNDLDRLLKILHINPNSSLLRIEKIFNK